MVFLGLVGAQVFETRRLPVEFLQKDAIIAQSSQAHGILRQVWLIDRAAHDNFWLI